MSRMLFRRQPGCVGKCNNATGLIVSGCQGQRYPDTIRGYLLLLNYLFNFRIVYILRSVSNYAGREHCERNHGIMLLGL